MTDLEAKRIKVEIMRVQAARAELELKIEERRDEIKRLEEHIKIQLKKEEELANKLT